MPKPRLSNKQIAAIHKMRGSGFKSIETAEILGLSIGCVNRVSDIFYRLSIGDFDTLDARYNDKYWHLVVDAADILGVELCDPEPDPCALEGEDGQEAPSCEPKPANTSLDMTNTYLVSMLTEIKEIRKVLTALLVELGI